jgi:hypothetical protein
MRFLNPRLQHQYPHFHLLLLPVPLLVLSTAMAKKRRAGARKAQTVAVA